MNKEFLIAGIIFIFVGLLALFGMPVWVKYEGWKHISISQSLATVGVGLFFLYLYKKKK